MSQPANFVTFETGKPKSLRFSKLFFEDRKIKDPNSGVEKMVRALVGQVISEDGQPSTKLFSTLSSKLQQKLTDFIILPNLESRTFVITKTGAGFLTEYTVQIS